MPSRRLCPTCIDLKECLALRRKEQGKALVDRLNATAPAGERAHQQIQEAIDAVATRIALRNNCPQFRKEKE